METNVRKADLLTLLPTQAALHFVSSPVQIAGAPDKSRGESAHPSKPTEPGTLLIIVVFKLVTLVVCFVVLAVDSCPYNIITRAQYYM